MVRLLIHLIVFLFGLFVLTQIVYPIVRGRKTFGLFRKSEDEKIVEAQIELDEAEAQLRIAQIKAKTEELRTEARKLELDALDSSISALEQHDESDDDSFQKDLKK